MTWVLKEDRAIASQGAAHEAGGWEQPLWTQGAGAFLD